MSAVAVVAAAAGAFGATAASAAPATAARPAGHGCNPSVSSQPFGSTPEKYNQGKDTPVFRYTLTNCNGMSAKILTYGAIAQSINVPGHGGTSDVVLGFKTLADYVKLRQPAGDRERRPVLRRDDRPVRQPHRQGHVHS